MKILLVEDDRVTCELLVKVLKTHHYVVDIAMDGQTGLELATFSQYDLIILDIHIPKLDGISICRQLRSQGKKVPILILTGNSSNDEVIAGLDSGADDYVIKPCNPTQLLARIRALLRRAAEITPAPLLTWKELCLDPASTQVTYQQQAIALSPKEYSLLELFLRHRQRVFSRGAILDHLWATDDFPTENAVTNLIKDLRRKLRGAGMAEDLIETVYGLGYRLKDPVEPLVKQEPGESDDPGKSASQPSQEERESASGFSLINQLVEKFQSRLGQRLTRLEAIAQRLETNPLTQEQHQEIREEAHRLAGSLGTYGYIKGSELSRAIEQLLSQNAQLKPPHTAQLAELLTQLKQEITQPLVAPAMVLPTHSSEPVVLLIDHDATFAREIQQEAQTWQIRVEVALDWSMVQYQLNQKTPDIILLSIDVASNPDGLTQLQTLRQWVPAVPVLTLAEQDSLTDRIQAMRMGSYRYLSKPIRPLQVLEVITQFLLTSQSLTARVLVVDDDPIALFTLSNLLQPWGLQVACLATPNQFWEVLTTTHPDLLLLDLEMPDFNGIELCRIVRQDSNYGDLPILVVTAHADIESVQQVFAAGADDLIAKPIVGPELVTRVISRIERSRLQQQLNQLRRQQLMTWAPIPVDAPPGSG